MLANARLRLISFTVNEMHNNRSRQLEENNTSSSTRSVSYHRFNRVDDFRSRNQFVNRSFPPPPSFHGVGFMTSTSTQKVLDSQSGQAPSRLSSTVFQARKFSSSTSSYVESAFENVNGAQSTVVVQCHDNISSFAPICISSEDSDVEEIHAPTAKPRVVTGLSLTGRQWEDVSSESTRHLLNENCVDFTVMSYNILSQQLLRENSYLYRTCSKRNLDERIRVERLLEELLFAKSDVVCLQEVEAQLFFEVLKPKFESLGYQTLYKKRTGSKPDGCALLVNSHKFDIVTTRNIEYYAPNVDLLDRDNVAIVAVLEAKRDCGDGSAKRSRISETPARFVVANTHLLFNQRRGDIKLAQLQYLLAEIDRMALFGVDASSAPYRLVVYYPILLCGDLNLEPYSPLYQFITEGYLQFQGMPRAALSGQNSPTSLALANAGPVMSRALLPDSFGLADNSEFAETCSVKNSMTSCVNSISGGPVIADVHKDVTKQIRSNDATQVRQYYSGTISHPFLLRPVYEYDTKVRGDFTSLTKGSRHTVDHIFYSVVRSASDPQIASTQEGRLHLLKRLQVPTYDVIKNGTIPQPQPSLPIESAPSDHIPLLAQFRFEISSRLKSFSS